jgi:hypothetical protein
MLESAPLVRVKPSTEGFELRFAVNYLAGFLLTQPGPDGRGKLPLINERRTPNGVVTQLSRTPTGKIHKPTLSQELAAQPDP